DLALLEVGPGQTLSVLVRQTEAPGKNNGHHGRLGASSLRFYWARRSDLDFLATSLGRLWAAGAAVDWAAFAERRGRVALPTYPFDRRRYWLASPGAPEPALKTLEIPMLAPVSPPAPSVPAPP